DVVNAWMASPTHQKNIVNTNYQEIGVAVLSGKIEGRNTIICVQFFGTSYVPEPEPAITTPTPSQEEPTPTPTPQPEPTPTPEPVPSTPPPPPAESLPESYSSELMNQSSSKINIQAGKAITVWADFKNTGEVDWDNTGNYFVALNATNPPGRVSDFKHNFWNEQYYRATRLDADTIKPGEIGRFTFALQAPQEPGEYNEDFQIVSEGVTFIEGGSVSFQITVNPIPVIESATDTEPAPAPAEPTEEVTAPAEPVAEPTEETNTNQPVINVNSQEETSSTQVVAEIKADKTENWVEKIINFTTRFYEVFLAFIIIALLINILVRIKVQHTSTIFHTILVVGLTLALLMIRFHFLESVPDLVRII
ncbi:hypothetical protein KKI23_03815, partial [Patescibacteria group bacterium]|nr:hypothetical protein [Patescibacteria group bacterium]